MTAWYSTPAARALFRAVRVRKGRPEFRATYRQWRADTRRMTDPVIDPDPILDLYVARQHYLTHRSPLAQFHAHNARCYGEIRQRVMSPVMLPADRAPAVRRLAA